MAKCESTKGAILYKCTKFQNRILYLTLLCCRCSPVRVSPRRTSQETGKFLSKWLDVRINQMLAKTSQEGNKEAHIVIFEQTATSLWHPATSQQLLEGRWLVRALAHQAQTHHLKPGEGKMSSPADSIPQTSLFGTELQKNNRKTFSFVFQGQFEYVLNRYFTNHTIAISVEVTARDIIPIPIICWKMLLYLHLFGIEVKQHTVAIVPNEWMCCEGCEKRLVNRCHCPQLQ